jgi:hypothetical protein
MQENHYFGDGDTVLNLIVYIKYPQYHHLLYNRTVLLQNNLMNIH